VEDRFGYSGPALDLLKDFGLCKDNIVKVTKEFIDGGKSK
jgi:transketolase